MSRSLSKTPWTILLGVTLIRTLAGVLPAFLLPAYVSARGESGLVWEQGEGYRRAKLNVPQNGKAGFTLLGPEVTQIRWTNYLSESRVAERQNLMNGAGVAAGDFDGDGLTDLYFCNKEGANALFRNLGSWKFEDVACSAGVTCTNQSSTGATWADLNGDGKLDLLVTSFSGPNACFLNEGHGKFINVTEAAGLVSRGGSTSMALADLDGDGDLDLYVDYFGIEAILRDGVSYGVRMVDGQPVVTGRYAKRLKIVNGRMLELGEPDILYVNDGKAVFAPVKWEETFQDEDGRPMSAPPDFGLAVQIRDINGDGLPDIYVCNDFQTPDRVWLNDGHGHFRAIDRLALRNMSFASMGVDFADIDRDGGLDFITVEMLSREHGRHLRQASPLGPKSRTPGQIENREEVARNALFWNRGDGTYAEIAYYSGVAASDWSWTPAFLDVDLDGFEDLLITNGHLFDVNDRDVKSNFRPEDLHALRMSRTLITKYPRLETPNAIFHNRGDLTFEDMGGRWGFDSRRISHGLVLADLDNDGDLDVVINCLNDGPLIYRNDSSAPRLAVRLRGKAPNTFGIGAKIEVDGGAVPVQCQEMICGGRYLSGDNSIRVFAAGTLSNQLSIKVTWRSGVQSLVASAAPNYLYEIDEAASKPTPKAAPALEVTPLFTDVSNLLGHKHSETDFDDFAQQPLLPRKLSQLGPGVAWVDLDGDGWDDLVLGAGRGGKLAVYRNVGGSRFEPWLDPIWAETTPDDLTGILGLKTASGNSTLYVGIANYEATEGRHSAIKRFTTSTNHVSSQGELSFETASAGPLAVTDLAGDGTLRMFVGGRFVPGRYPEPASSRLYRQNGDDWELDVENSRALEKVGLVSGAVFSDLDGDGFPELILACEWGPIRIFQNQSGKLREITHEMQMDQFTGLWASVTTVDLDGDGKPDIIAGNWGLNSFYNLAPDGLWFLYYGDFNADGQINMVEAYYDQKMKQIVPWRDLEAMGRGMPWLRERFSTHREFSTANIQRVLADRFDRAVKLEAKTLQSLVFLNRGDHFEPRPLPMQAQWSPAFALCTGDMNGDGYEDLFISQNFFAVRAEDDRLDAGRGLCLLGAGNGSLRVLPGPESGIKVYGEQRGAALCDFDGDGRPDLVVTQNGAETKLYKNTGGKPGLHVRIKGSPGNPNGIGAVLRIKSATALGPAREVRAGGGYWSQDSVVQTLSSSEAVTGVWIRWPGGKTTTVPVPEGAREIQVDQDGKVSVKR